MMKILVAGGAGFIGGNFIMRQMQNEDVKILNFDKLTYAGNLEALKPIEGKSNYEFIRGDICSYVDVRNALETLGWDGTSWTQSGTLSTGRGYMHGVGGVLGGLVAGGKAPSIVTCTELYNGGHFHATLSAWASSNNMITARRYTMVLQVAFKMLL